MKTYPKDKSVYVTHLKEYYRISGTEESHRTQNPNNFLIKK